MRYHHTIIEMTKIKKKKEKQTKNNLIKQSAGEVKEQLEFSYIACRNTKC